MEDTQVSVSLLSLEWWSSDGVEDLRSSLEVLEPSSIIDPLAGTERSALWAASRRFLAPTRSVFLRELSNEDCIVREEAVLALPGLVGKGDGEVIKAVSLEFQPPGCPPSTPTRE